MSPHAAGAIWSGMAGRGTPAATHPPYLSPADFSPPPTAKAFPWPVHPRGARSPAPPPPRSGSATRRSRSTSEAWATSSSATAQAPRMFHVSFFVMADLPAVPGGDAAGSGHQHCAPRAPRDPPLANALEPPTDFHELVDTEVESAGADHASWKHEDHPDAPAPVPRTTARSTRFWRPWQSDR